MSNFPKSVNTAEARAFFLDHADLIPEGDKSVGAGVNGRGRLSKAAKAVLAEQGIEFVESTKSAQTMLTLNYTHVQPSGKKVKKTAEVSTSEVRVLARESGMENVPERGKFSAAVLDAAGEAYAKRAVAARGEAKAPKASPVETEATEAEAAA